MSARPVKLRYSINGINEDQLNILFDYLNNETNQIMIKRITNPRFSLSIDDLILEGFFSNILIENLSRLLPPPISVTFNILSSQSEKFARYSAINWNYLDSVILGGVTLIPINQVTNMIDVSSIRLFMNLISSTPAASFLKAYLLIKPKGIVRFEKDLLQFVLPNHRVDFITKWTERIIHDLEINFDWLSGSTGELSEEIVSNIGSIDQRQVDNLKIWLNSAINSLQSDYNKMYRRALKAIL